MKSTKLFLRIPLVLFVLALMCLFANNTLLAQIPAAISISPADASADDTITLTYNPKLGCGPEKWAAAKITSVRLHSGAITIGQNWPSDWGQYTIEEVNVPKDGVHKSTEMIINADGTYSMKFVPRAYYGVPKDSIIIGISAVFAGNHWAIVGSDTAEAGCIDFKVALKPTSPVVSSVKSVGLNNSLFSISPNPATDFINVVSANVLKEVVLSDLSGRQLLSHTLLSSNYKFNTSELKSGLYIITVKDINGLIGTNKCLIK